MEVYGVKPKKFTKEWWPYFWEYYKWHTIVGAVLLVILISSLVECANRTDYDLQADIITENKVSSESIDSLTALIQDNIDDITGNGKNEAYVTYLDMGESSDPQFVQAMQTKYMVEIGYGESYIFLVSKEYADRLIDTEVFEVSTSWTDKASYKGYCISLEGNKLLEDAGFDTSDLYIGIVKLRENDRKSEREKNITKQANAIRFAQYLVSKG